MAANPSISNLNLIRKGPQIALETSEPKPSSLRQRIELLLRKIFAGHEELLGWTPD